VPVDWAAANLGNKPKNTSFPADATLGALTATKIPRLHVGGDHDIIFAVENWYTLIEASDAAVADLSTRRARPRSPASRGSRTAHCHLCQFIGVMRGQCSSQSALKTAPLIPPGARHHAPPLRGLAAVLAEAP
jgi:hypothetical protein